MNYLLLKRAPAGAARSARIVCWPLDSVGALGARKAAGPPRPEERKHCLWEAMAPSWAQPFLVSWRRRALSPGQSCPDPAATFMLTEPVEGGGSAGVPVTASCCSLPTRPGSSEFRDVQVHGFVSFRKSCLSRFLVWISYWPAIWG